MSLFNTIPPEIIDHTVDLLPPTSEGKLALISLSSTCKALRNCLAATVFKRIVISVNGIPDQPKDNPYSIQAIQLPKFQHLPQQHVRYLQIASNLIYDTETHQELAERSDPILSALINHLSRLHNLEIDFHLSRHVMPQTLATIFGKKGLRRLIIGGLFMQKIPHLASWDTLEEVAVTSMGGDVTSIASSLSKGLRKLTLSLEDDSRQQPWSNISFAPAVWETLTYLKLEWYAEDIEKVLNELQISIDQSSSVALRELVIAMPIEDPEDLRRCLRIFARAELTALAISPQDHVQLKLISLITGLWPALEELSIFAYMKDMSCVWENRPIEYAKRLSSLQSLRKLSINHTSVVDEDFADSPTTPRTPMTPSSPFGALQDQSSSQYTNFSCDVSVRERRSRTKIAPMFAGFIPNLRWMVFCPTESYIALRIDRTATGAQVIETDESIQMIWQGVLGASDQQ